MSRKKMNSSAVMEPQSLGPVGQLFTALVQSLVASWANISPEEMWPEDRGAYGKGKMFHDLQF